MADIHSFSVEVAVKYGVNAAILLRHIGFWVEKNRANGKHAHDGRYWTYNSFEAFIELFPYMTEWQVRSALQKLENNKIIVSGNYNSAPYDRTKWYTLTDAGEALCNVKSAENALTVSSVNSTNGFVDSTNGICENHRPIPDSNTVNKERNKKERKSAYGVLGNVFLTDEELAKLKAAFKSDWQRRIDTLSEYIASKGDKYKSHYATILSWYRRENGGKSVAEREYF